MIKEINIDSHRAFAAAATRRQGGIILSLPRWTKDLNG